MASKTTPWAPRLTKAHRRPPLLSRSCHIPIMSKDAWPHCYNNSHPSEAAFEGQLHHSKATKAVPIQSLLQMSPQCFLLFPRFQGHVGCVPRGPSYPKIHCRFKVEEMFGKNGGWLKWSGPEINVQKYILNFILNVQQMLAKRNILQKSNEANFWPTVTSVMFSFIYTA